MPSINELYSLLKLNEVEGKSEGNTFVIGSSEYVPLPPSPEPEPIDGFSIMLYKNIAENHRVDKTPYLTAVGGLDGALREGTNLVAPTILIYYEKFPDFNYVYIAPFKRYYYVSTIDIVRTNLYEISLGIDVLMTYREGIYNLQAFVERNQFNNNPMLVDKKRVVEEGINVETYSIDNMLLSNTFIQPNTDVMYVLNGYKIDSADRTEL